MYVWYEDVFLGILIENIAVSMLLINYSGRNTEGSSKIVELISILLPSQEKRISTPVIVEQQPDTVKHNAIDYACTLLNLSK